ncbi:hypothetical protein N8I71_13020 [Roseibacterium sp. SDUM158016]|uniref:hypothetical protein n=1 Tax=Roseicyclus sediminis TaxID=2980997 RepID=UPI0021CFEFBF|nr:hypothetical protein [Roseibacterium sp. SDUM158016]MCU4653759.1 hypothetical protein [Roseibacterium sp. SDUM158016]
MDFAGYQYVATLIVLAEIAIISLTYRRNPKLAIYAALLSLMLKGQYLWVGRPIYAWQIAALFGLIYLARGQARSVVLPAGRGLSAFHVSMLLYFIYTFSISVPMWLLFSLEELGNSGTQVSISRIVTQTFYFLFLVGLYGFGVRAGRYLDTFVLLRAIIMIATVVAYGAIIQTLIVRYAGINIFPIIGSDGTLRSAFILDTTFRATSFAGEPKHLGLAMAIGLIAIFLTRLFRIPIGGFLAIHKPMSMLVALLLSLSSTGYFIAMGGIGLAAALFFRRLRRTDLVVISLLATVLLTQVIGSGGNFGTTLERQLDRTEFEVQDQSVRDGLLANPAFLFTGTGLGNIHLIAVEFLPSNFPLFRTYGYKANSGLFFVLGDSGLIGLLLLILGPLFAARSYFRMRKFLTPWQRKEALSTLALIVVAVFSFAMRFDVIFFMFSGFVFTRLALLRAQVVAVRQPMVFPQADWPKSEPSSLAVPT